MSHRVLFEIASDNRYSSSLGSTALLAVQRYVRRLLKQMGVGFLSLILLWSITTQGANAQMADGQSSDDLYRQSVPTAPMQMSMPHRSPGQQPSQPSGRSRLAQDSHLSDRHVTASSPALPAEGKPFQALRPKMTHHRLTTSRLSIPTELYKAISLSDSE